MLAWVRACGPAVVVLGEVLALLRLSLRGRLQAVMAGWRRAWPGFGAAVCGSSAGARRCRPGGRASKASRMGWLRTGSRQGIHRVSGVRPVRRHQPRAMLVVAGSLRVENVRSEPVRRV